MRISEAESIAETKSKFCKICDHFSDAFSLDYWTIMVHKLKNLQKRNNGLSFESLKANQIVIDQKRILGNIKHLY